ncbi:myb family transcription factor PHL5 [Neltuma alba]|uniref:myb family transcription factor PHL5 n=1 Tax=Neltuma alba TaxID=207710 RepID=UPI0010A38C76|nr:myb family transcription factor PHL5-like [Prosopis alba]
MNENMVDFSGRVQVQQSHGLNGDCNSEFANGFCEYVDINQAWNMGSCSQTLAVAGGGAQQPPNQGPAKSAPTIMSRFESPASAFYATERCMGFQVQQYDSQIGNPSLTSQFPKLNDLEFPLYQSDPSVELSNTLQAMVKSPSINNQYYRSPEKSNKVSYGNVPTTNPTQQHSLFINDAALVKRSSTYKGNQDHTMSFSSQQEKFSPPLTSEGSVSTVSGNHGSNGTAVSSKTRIRWNQDLHEKFVECVNRLGGAEKATPKAILKLMESDGLTIFHVKSHLQKYRIAKYMPDSAQGKPDKRSNAEDVLHLDTKTGLQLREALHLQLDVQRRLHEQLEIQRKLQLRIEEQGRQLKKMFDQQQKTSDSLLNTQNLSSTANDNNDTSNNHRGVELSTFEGSGNSFFPSKIS